jgi:hypothetical protein
LFIPAIKWPRGPHVRTRSLPIYIYLFCFKVYGEISINTLP